MAASAESNEIIVNNLLHIFLKDRPELTFEKREGITKAGEEFLAYSMKFKKKPRKKKIKEEEEDGHSKETNKKKG